MSKKPFISLAESHPEIAAEADGWNSKLFTSGSNKKKDWKCKLGHKWIASINHRTSGTKCPVCSNKKVLSGFNDLKTKFPKIAESANGWDTTKVAAFSNVKYSWICELKHEWIASVASRTNVGAGCPYCTNRKVLKGFNDLKTLYPQLANEAEGWDPSEIAPGSGKIKKWKCPKGHNWQASPNNRTNGNTGCPICTGRMVKIGFNDLLTTHPELCLEIVSGDPTKFTSGSKYQITWKCKNNHTFKASIYNRAIKKTNCPRCLNRGNQIKHSVLSDSFPEIAKDAYGWDPSEISAGSGKIKDWKCPDNHIYRMSIDKRTLRKQGCPICSGHKILIGFNDLSTTHPNLLDEIDGWDPTKYSKGSEFKASWICKEGHRWKTLISNRTLHNQGCPSCAKTGFDPNSVGYLYFISHEIWQMLQIGITNNPKKRLGEHKKLGWEILEIRGPMDGHLTQQWETAILRMLKAKGADLANSKIAGKFDGYSEAWSVNKFKVRSINELMEMTENFETKF